MTYMTSKFASISRAATATLTVIGLAVIGTIAIAAPAHAGHNDDINVNNGGNRSFPGMGLSRMYERMDTARYDARVLDPEFFEALAFYGPASPVARSFRDAIPAINWYGNDFARQWILQNEYDAYQRFIAVNRVSVYFDIEGASNEAAHNARHYAARSLPEYAWAARNRRDADIVVKVRFNFSGPEVGVSKVSQKRKKYKKKVRKNPNPNARLIYATYDKVREKVWMQMKYRIKVMDGRQVIFSDRNVLKFSDSYRFATNFRAYGPAAGPAGWTTDAPYPSRKVRKLATRNIDASRAQTIHKLETRAARALAQNVAGLYIPLRSELAPSYRRYSYNAR